MRSKGFAVLLIFLCLSGFVLMGPPSEAAEYYVGLQADAAAEQNAGTQPMGSLSEVMNRLQPGDTVYLTGGTYISPEVISAKGTADKPITICPAPGQEPIIKQTTWKLEQAQYIILTGLTFKDCSPALELRDDASYNTIEKNRFLDCPPLSPTKLKKPTSWQRALLGRGPNAHHNQITGNEFKRKYEGAYSINESLNVLEGNRYWVIRGNHIEGYMYGLQLGIGSLGGPPAYILVEGNDITNCNCGMHIKTGDNQIRGNHIADMQYGYGGCGSGIYLRSSPRTVVENNRIERAQWVGIRVLGKDQLVRNNIVTDTPVGVWLSHHSYGSAKQSNWVVHNTITDATLPMWIESAGEAFVYNNIFAASSPKNGQAAGIYVAGSPDENPMIAYEKWYKRMAGDNDGEPGILIASHNLYFNALPPTGSPANVRDDKDKDIEWWGGYNILADPGFVDPKSGDWRLKPDSPARGVGRPLPNAALDINGVLRPDQPDLGAYQAMNRNMKISP